MSSLIVAEETSLSRLIDRAANALTGAKTSAEILEAKEIASAAYDLAKRTARLSRAKQAHDDVLQRVYRAQADALEIEAGAKRRLADEYDAAQERGELSQRGGDRRGEAFKVGNSNFESLGGISKTDIHEARSLRDAEKADPGIIRRTLDERIDRGEEPSKAAIREAILYAAKHGIRGTDPMSRRRPTGVESDPQFEAMLVVAGNCRDLLSRAGSFAPEYIIGGFIDEGMRERNLETIRRCRNFLTQILETADAEHEA